MEETPKLSIVVAVKDGAENVSALLDAVMDQPDRPELILCRRTLRKKRV